MEFWPTFGGLFCLITGMLTMLAAVVETARSAEWTGKAFWHSLIASAALAFGLLWLLSAVS